MLRACLAKVVHVNPQAHSVDLVTLDTNDRIANVPVLVDNISTASGALSLPQATAPSTPYGVQDTGLTDVLAMVLFIRNIPFVIGFKTPEIGQMTFADGRKIERHDSDVYESTDLKGNWEKHWPNGTFVRIGTSAAHEDLTGKDFDGLWALTKNTGAQLYITLKLPNGKGVTFDPLGNLVSSAPDWAHTGNINVTGSVEASGNLGTGTGASGCFTTGTGAVVTVIDGIVVNIAT
jgi:hypothetical protein